MTRSHLSVFLLLAVLLPALRAPAQERRRLTLDEAVAAALENNRDIHIAALDEKIAGAKYRQTDAIFLPQAGISYTAMATNNPLNAFGFKLQQRIITQNDFNPDLLNHPSQTNDFSAKLEVTQPLLNPDMIFQRKAAKNEAELYALKSRRTREYLEFRVKSAYYQLQLAAKAKKVIEEALDATKAVYTFTENRVKQGLLQRSDLLNVRVKVLDTESSLASAESNIRNASDFLSLLMNRPSGTVYDTEELKQLPDDPQLKELQNVPAGRADLQAMEKAVTAAGNGVKATELSLLPRVNAFGNYQLNDNSFAGSQASSWMAGVTLSWSLFSGTKTKHQVAQQKLERDKLSTQLDAQKDQAKAELDQARRELLDAGYRSAQAQAAVEQAQEALRILRNRYEQGLANTTDVLMAQTQLSQQQLSLAQSVYQINVTTEQLHFLTSSTEK